MGVGGVARQFYSGGKALSEYAEGDTVYITESGKSQSFYVAKHNYESGQNGPGRTLLVRTSPHTSTKWGYYPRSYYDSSLHVVMSEYLKRFSQPVQTAIGLVKIYCEGYYNHCAVFALSAGEFGLLDGSGGIDMEGSALPIAKTLKMMSGQKWTRTMPSGSGNPCLCGQATQSNVQHMYASYCDPTEIKPARPAFTLGATTQFDPSTNMILL